MSKLSTKLNKAEYLFRPQQLMKRLLNSAFSTNKVVKAKLPWGNSIHVKADEDIGRAILTLGLYDLTVSEIIYRLCKSVRTPKINLDVGANIGYMSSVLLHSMSSQDKLFCFEPHPLIYQKLLENLELSGFKKDYQAFELALSSEKGTLDFMLPSNFNENEGLGFLASNLTKDKMPGAKTLKQVETDTLDTFFKNNEHIFLMKIDNEGNELLVLQGAFRMLSEKRIQHIVYEDHNLYPNNVSNFLEGFGYKIYFLKRGLLKPNLLKGSASTREKWEPNNFLATLDPTHVEGEMKSFGWQILR